MTITAREDLPYELNENIYMWKDLIAKAEKVYEPDGYTPRKPATIEEVGVTIKSAKEKIDLDLPKSYLKFLEHKNGFGFEGLIIYNAIIENGNRQTGHFYRDVIDANELWRDFEDHKDYLFFGDADLYLYCLNLITG